MSERSFNQLVDILRPQVYADEFQSFQSTSGNDPITPEIVVAAGLRFLGGEKPKSIADIYGISIPSVDRILNNFLDAVDDKLKIKLPETNNELQKCADNWINISGAFGVFYGIVGWHAQRN